MVLMYQGFEGGKVFKWARGNKSHITVMFPAEPFFDRCIDRVLREYRAGSSVLAWGDPAGLNRLSETLKERRIPLVPLGDSVSRRRSVAKVRSELSMSLL